MVKQIAWTKITLVLAALLCVPPASNADPVKLQSKQMHGSVSENEMIDDLERVGIKCIYQIDSATKTNKGSLIVNTIRLGSAAFYKGLEVGDKIKSVVAANNNFTLQIERNGQPFQIQLRALTPSLESPPVRPSIPLQGDVQRNNHNQQIPVVSVAPPTAPLLNVSPPPQERPKDKEKKLMQYDIELIIDITGSMLEHDGTGDLSKFEWCHEQVRNFARLMEEYNRTLTITTFNTTFNTEYHCTPARVEEIYGAIRPKGNTCLVDPLLNRLDYALHHRTPGRATIIAVITDGLPNVPQDPRVVNTALIDFTKRLSNANDVVVTFLQIGDTFNGKSFCVDLDDNLVNEGAKFDIVDTKTFDDLKTEGLTQALIDAVTEKRTVRIDSASRRLKMSAGDAAKLQNVDAKLREKMDERKALEKLLNINKAENP
ncbi:MAG: hypothetical protein U0103_05320 [Candidatus Obscuribacterales bacterium]